MWTFQVASYDSKQMYNIQLSPEEAEQFKLWREHQDSILPILQSGLFNLRNGKATLSFDHQGSLQEIKFDILAYRKKSTAMTFDIGIQGSTMLMRTTE